jgi:uncharacterized membrane protein HdeD (DUF308 family)
MKGNPFKNWWSLAFNGVIALLYGVLAIFIPEDTLITILTWFGIIVLVIGGAMLIGVINNIRNNYPYVNDLIMSLVTIAFGALLAFYTTKSIEIFVIVIGVWAIVIGVAQLYLMSKLESDDKNKNTFLINGIVSVVFGVILMFNPFASAQALVIITGVMAFFIGVMLIIIALKMKNLSNEIES